MLHLKINSRFLVLKNIGVCDPSGGVYGFELSALQEVRLMTNVPIVQNFFRWLLIWIAPLKL